MTRPRWWYWPPWRLSNPLWPPFWRGGDEWGRATIVIQPPLLGAFIIAYGPEEEEDEDDSNADLPDMRE